VGGTKVDFCMLVRVGRWLDLVCGAQEGNFGQCWKSAFATRCISAKPTGSPTSFSPDTTTVAQLPRRHANIYIPSPILATLSDGAVDTYKDMYWMHCNHISLSAFPLYCVKSPIPVISIEYSNTAPPARRIPGWDQSIEHEGIEFLHAESQAAMRVRPWPWAAGT